MRQGTPWPLEMDASTDGACTQCRIRILWPLSTHELPGPDQLRETARCISMHHPHSPRFKNLKINACKKEMLPDKVPRPQVFEKSWRALDFFLANTALILCFDLRLCVRSDVRESQKLAWLLQLSCCVNSVMLWVPMLLACAVCPLMANCPLNQLAMFLVFI